MSWVTVACGVAVVMTQRGKSPAGLGLSLSSVPPNFFLFMLVLMVFRAPPRVRHRSDLFIYMNSSAPHNSPLKWVP